MSISGNYTNPYSSYGASSLGSGSSSVDSSSSSGDVKFSNGYTPSSSSASSASEGGTEHKSGGIGGFFKGIFNGAKNAVHSLFTPKGLLMAGAGLAACVAFPVAAPLALGGLAVAGGGAKMFSAAKNHDAEGMGEGFFTAGAGAVGIKGSGAIGSLRGGSGSGAAAEGAGASSGSSSGGFFSSIKSGLSKLNPLNWFKSKPAASEPAAATETAPAQTARATQTESSGGLPPNPQNQGPNGGSATTREQSPLETESSGTPTVNLPSSNAAAQGENAAATTSGATDAATSDAAAQTDNAATNAADATSKPKLFQGARDNIGNAWNYSKGNNLPEGAPTNPFVRTGQVLTGKAPGVNGKPVWTLPSSTALSGQQPNQPAAATEQAAG